MASPDPRLGLTPFLDEVDREAIEAERNASPHAFPGPRPLSRSHSAARTRPRRRSADALPSPSPGLEQDAYQRRPSDEIERVSTTASSATTSSHQPRGPGAGAGPDADQLSYRATSMSRVPTHLEPLDRYPTDLVRIATQRSQHSETVGRRVSTRRSRFSRRSEKPLPAFGGGKEYPPMLPERDEYVVEFDGEHDPLHPHNWPFKKK